MTGRGWLLFTARRLVALVVLLVVISFVVFSLLYISPGSVIDSLLGTNPRTPEEIRYLTNEYHLNQPFWTQYWIWASQALRLHFGTSIQTSLPVTNEIRTRLPTTLFLGLYAYILTIVLGVGGGISASWSRSRAPFRPRTMWQAPAPSRPAAAGPRRSVGRPCRRWPRWLPAACLLVSALLRSGTR